MRLFIDDIFCCTKNGHYHVGDLARLFIRLRQYNLKLAPMKAHIGVPVVGGLGHHVSAGGFEPDPDKAEAPLDGNDHGLEPTTECA